MLGRMVTTNMTGETRAQRYHPTQVLALDPCSAHNRVLDTLEIPKLASKIHAQRRSRPDECPDRHLWASRVSSRQDQRRVHQWEFRVHENTHLSVLLRRLQPHILNRL